MYLAVLTSRRVPKSDAPLEECEDATSPVAEHCSEVPLGPGALSVAVADGATTYSYSKEWAEIICRQLEQRPVRDVADLLERLPAWQMEWQQAVGPRLTDLPWFAAAKAEQGAFSTFLQVAVTVDPGENRDGTWTALALGDSCLVQLRNNKPLLRGEPHPLPFPLNNSQAFIKRPFLLPTRPELIPQIQEHILATQGTWKEGDEFLLMTDALAAWFIGALEAGESPMEHLRAFLNSVGEIVDSPATPSSQDASTSEPGSQEPEEGANSQPHVLDQKQGLKGKIFSFLHPRRSEHAAVQTFVPEPITQTEEDELMTIEPILEDPEEDGIITPSLDETFASWAERQKSSGALKDDDVSLVHVRTRLKKEEHA